MDKAKRARTAETPKQPSLGLKLRAPYLYPDLKREASNSAGRNNGKSVSPEILDIGSAEPFGLRRRQVRVAKELDICSDGSPGT